MLYKTGQKHKVCACECHNADVQHSNLRYTRAWQ